MENKQKVHIVIFYDWDDQPWIEMVTWDKEKASRKVEELSPRAKHVQAWEWEIE